MDEEESMDNPADLRLTKTKPHRNIRFHSRVWSCLFPTFGVLGVFVGLIAWAMVSPVAGSPDDDYHLGSIWCPNAVEGGSCEAIISDGVVTNVMVPETVYMSQHCWAFHPETSAACSDALLDTNFVPSYRFDDGSYPKGFYDFHHLFVGPDVHKSAVLMRVVNVVLGLGGLVLIGLLARPKSRQNLLVAATAAWVPMGVYFIASNNPSSWAISGSLIYGAGLITSTEAMGWRRWALLGVSTLGAVMAMTSRADSAFYVFVITLGVWFLVPLSRRVAVQLAASMILSVLALLNFVSTSQAGNLTSDGGWPIDPNMSFSGVFLRNILYLPEYVASFWGLGMGPGWLDVPLPGWSTLMMLVLFGGVVFVGARVMNLRKGLASGVLFGAMVGIPVVTMTMRHVQPLTYYQGRYMLPLLAVALFVWLSAKSSETLLASHTQLVLISIVASVANSAALFFTSLRFSVGIGGGKALSFRDVTWWPWSIGPMAVWFFGSLFMMLGLVALFWSGQRYLGADVVLDVKDHAALLLPLGPSDATK